MISVTEFLSPDDWLYAALLIGSFGLSWALRSSGNARLLAVAGGPLGFLLALLVLRQRILYSLPIAVFGALAIQFAPQRRLTSIVFVVAFVYLLIVRHLHYFVSISELASQANGLQLIITLRIIGLAFEVSDARESQRKEASDVKPVRRLAVEPSLFEIFSYFYHFCGLFTGPYYTYQMLVDSHNPVLLSGYSPNEEITSRIVRLFWSVPLFIITNHLFPLDGLRSDSVWDFSLAYRLFYAAAVFVVFRMRVYSAWALSESICVTMGIGIYPVEAKARCVVGPTDLAAFERFKDQPDVPRDAIAIDNLNIPDIETSDGFRSGIRAWNKSVQTWLALFVHSRAARAYRVELTMFVSALWHGTYAGYFMSFLVVPMCTEVEDIIYYYVPTSEDGKRPTWFRYLYTHTLRMRGFDFLATGFLLKNFSDTHRFWSSLCYWLPALMFPIYLASKVFRLGPRKEKKPKAQ